MDQFSYNLRNDCDHYFVYLFFILALENIYRIRLFEYDRWVVSKLWRLNGKENSAQKCIYFLSKCAILRIKCARVRQFSSFIDALAKINAKLAIRRIVVDFSELRVQN